MIPGADRACAREVEVGADTIKSARGFGAVEFFLAGFRVVGGCAFGVEADDLGDLEGAE